MSMKINRLEIENVKRIKAVKLEPAENGLTIIGGNNNQGKTSVLDSIAWALGGDRYRPSQATREGSVIPPYLHIVMNNGLVVERKGKNSDLKVTDPSGKKAGQQLLNEFVNQLALDLPKFMEANGKEKAQILLQIIGVGDRLTQRFADCYRLDQTADRLFALLKRFKELVFLPGANPMEQFSALLKSQQEKEKAQRTQSVDKVEKQIQALLTGELEKDGEALLSLPEPTPQSVFDTVKQGLEALVERRKQEVEQTSAQLDFAFDFLEAAFGRGQELVWFVTQLAGGYYSSWFIAQFGCVRFDQYNESLLFEKRRSQLLDQVDRLEQS